MVSNYEPLHFAAEVDVDSQVWAGVADYQGQPHLVLGELFDLDQPRVRTRLGQTFFLIAVTPDELRAILKEWRASLREFDGDPTWEQKLHRWEKAWAAFKEKHLRQAKSAWRVRGSFLPQNAKGEDFVRWKLLRKTPVTGDQVRARMARVEQLAAARYGNPSESTGGDEEPF
jgi:hypothetical protein